MAANIAGLAWNFPNTAAGITYGVIGTILGVLGGTAPGIFIDHNAIQFTNNPLMGSAMTMGNAIIYGGGIFQPDSYLRYTQFSLGTQEEQHTYQGQVLGPFYFPAHILFGIAGLVSGGDWHAPANILESGPHPTPPNQFTPPQPWPP
jgi:hypothetical protein